MYKKANLIETLDGVLDLLPNNLSSKGIQKKEQLKKDLKKLNAKTQNTLQQKDNEIVKG